MLCAITGGGPIKHKQRRLTYWNFLFFLFHLFSLTTIRVKLKSGMYYTYAHVQHPRHLTSTAVTSTAIVSTRMFCFLRTRHVCRKVCFRKVPLTRDRRITIVGTAPASRRSEINEPNISTLFWPKLCRLRTTKLYVSVFRNRL